MYKRMDIKTIQTINSRLYFGAGVAETSKELAPWQHVIMSYNQVGLTTPSYVPPLDTLEDADIWMCLDARMNYKMRETPMAG